MALDPTPQRQRVLSFVSPDVGDLLFYETVDVQRVGDTNVPPYGTPHPDYKKWPDHKLVLISASDANSDRQGRYFRYYYAAERQNQDEYNFECGSSQIGGLTVNTVTRTYITLRSSFDPNAEVLEIGSAMPNVPEGKFTGSWVLYDSDQKRIGNQELDSLFVVEQRVYIQPVTATGATYGEIVTTEDTIASVVPDTEDVETGIDIISSQVTPIGNGQAIKVTKAVRDGWPDPVQIATGSPPEGLPPTLYRDNLRSTTITRKVADIPEDIELTGSEIGKTYKRETPDRVEEEVTSLTFDVYDGLLEQSINRTAYLITTRETVASATGELPLVGDGSFDLLYRSGDLTIYRNTTVTTEGVAGLKGVDTATQTWGSITETTNYTLEPEYTVGGSTRLIFKDSMTEVYESTTVEVNAGGTTKDTDPQVWGSIEWDGEFDTSPSGVRSRQVWTNGAVQVYLNENPTLTVNSTPFTSAIETNSLLTETQTTTYATTPSTPTNNSSSRVIYQLDSYKVYENTQTLIEPSETPRVYASVIQYDLPSILNGIEILSFPLRNGGAETHFKPNVEEGLSGTFPCEVTEYYTESPTVPDLGDLQAFRPKPVSFTTPWGGLSLGATLHDDLSFTYSTGTKDPRYKYAVGTVSIPATTPTTYKDLTFLAAFNATPYKNGFVVREYRITTPP
jgi:hypothetical protein